MSRFPRHIRTKRARERSPSFLLLILLLLLLLLILYSRLCLMPARNEHLPQCIDMAALALAGFDREGRANTMATPNFLGAVVGRVVPQGGIAYVALSSAVVNAINMDVPVQR